MQEEREKRVQWIYSSRDNRELEERYDVWAKDYDADLDEGFGWLGPKKAVDAFERFVYDKKSKILDVGAGTGLVGQLLAEDGYTDIGALDLSKGMLEEAAKKGAYNSFYQRTLGEPLGFPADAFDAVISVGTFTLGHAPAGAFDEIVRIIKPGGYFIFSLRPDTYLDSGFKEKQESLERNGKWKLIEEGEQFQTLPKGEPDVYHQVWVYQIN